MSRASATAIWLLTSLGFGAVTGAGVLSVVNHKTPRTVATAWPVARPGAAASASASPSASATPHVESGVRADGTHFGAIIDFLLPVSDGLVTGPDDGELGNSAPLTAAELDAQVDGMFPKLQKSDLTSAKGAMAAAHMKDGALRTYANSAGTLDLELTVLQLDPTMAAKSTSEFGKIVSQSDFYRAGPPVDGYPDAHCVLPATRPGDKLDAMICLGTVGDTFVIGTSEGTVPMDQKVLTRLFARQLDVLKKGVGK